MLGVDGTRLLQIADELASLTSTCVPGFPEHCVIGTGFSYIGSGRERDSYIHRESNIVLKVPTISRRSLHMKPINMTPTQALEQAHQRYRELNVDKMAAFGFRYAETVFLHASIGTPMIAQEFLPHPRFIPAHEEVLDPEQLQFADEVMSYPRRGGFYDFCFENAMFDTVTGQVVMFDCLTGSSSAVRPPF